MKLIVSEVQAWYAGRDERAQGEKLWEVFQQKFGGSTKYSMVKFVRRWRHEDGSWKLDFRDAPFAGDWAGEEAGVLEFLAGVGYRRLEDAELRLPVPDVVLELREGVASVYNCLFEDVAGYFPY